MTSVSLHEGDNRLSLRRMIDAGVRVHSVVTDPPYGLVSIQKRFGKEGSAPARREKNDGSFARLSGGFMGKVWDGSGIERDPEFWKLIYEILLPGGYVFAFSGSRTGHWQACAMEMAGFIMHPMHGWVFGSGFPKASNAERAIDSHKCTKPGRHYEGVLPKDPRPDDHICDSHEDGDQWSGWGYGTQAQKPALEPIYLGQKPFDCKTGAKNLLKNGVGAVNIDACRVGGRHPANLILDGSPEVISMFPAKAGASAPVKGTEPSGVTKEIFGKFNSRVPGTFFNDEGSAARFFHHFPPDTQPLIYNGKAAKADRAGSNHPTVKPVALMRYLVRHITPPGGTVLDPFAGTGTTGVAALAEHCECILMEAEPEYIDFLKKRFDLGGPVDMFDDLLGTEDVSDFEDLLG